MKILLTGFFGEENIGDEAILRAIFANLSEHDRLTITCGHHPALSGPRLLPRKGLTAWPEFLRALNSCDRAIFSGGILQDWSFDGTIFFALRILAASVFNARPSLWGAGLGPIRRLTTKKIAKKALSRIKTAWLRDEASVKLFKSLTNNGNKTAAKLGTDFSWHFPVDKSENAGLNGPLGLNIRNWPFSNWKPDLETQLKHVDRQILGIAARPGDQLVIKKLAPTATLLRPASFSGLANLCGNLSYGLAMRYHVALAMLRSDLPVKLIAYDVKVAGLASEANIELLSNNQLSDFRRAEPDFVYNNMGRYKAMQKAFKEFIARP